MRQLRQGFRKISRNFFLYMIFLKSCLSCLLSVSFSHQIVKKAILLRSPSCLLSVSFSHQIVKKDGDT